MSEPISRRTFVAVGPAAFTWFWAGSVSPSEQGQSGRAPRTPHQPGGGDVHLDHPDPRDGIDASLVLTDEALEGADASVRATFALVREMPEIADGIACYCGCDQRESYRSLLTCFYAEGMARGCQICQGEARLAHRRWSEGQTLDQIRRAIDARYA